MASFVGEHSCKPVEGGEMDIRIVVALFLVLGPGSPPLFAQQLCEDCLTEAKHLLTQCLEGAISTEDKQSCSERQQARSQGCERSQCVTEQSARKPDKPVEQQPPPGAEVKEEARER
jgi:hypothetical protein